MEDKELYNPQNGEVIKAKRPKQFWKDWRFYVYTLIAIMLAIVSFSSCLTACAAINAGVGQKEDASYSVAQRKNALITTDGGYNGFTLTFTTAYPSQDLAWNGNIYTVDTSFNLSLVETFSGTLSDYTSGVVSAQIQDLYNSAYEYNYTDRNNLYLIDFYCYRPSNPSLGAYPYVTYFSFVVPQFSSAVNGFTDTVFIFLDSSWNPHGSINMENGRLSLTMDGYIGTLYTDTQKDTFYFDDDAPSTLVFQDVASYYKELGYQNGYDVGNSEGYSSGYGVGNSAGYNEGYASGNANGYACGYEQATHDYQTGIAFTSYGLYANAQLTLTTDEVIGNYSYMYLFKYVTSNYDEHTVYVLFTQNSSTSQYLGYVLDRNDSDDSTSAVTIGSFSAQSSLAVTITAEQDQYFELYTGFVTSFYDRGSEVIEAVWFSGGTSQTALQNYQDGYDTGYQDGVSAGYGSGYDAGYRVGEVAGINQAEPEALTNTLVAVFQQPFNQIYRFFNFNILGLNVLGLATGLLSVFIIIKVFKKVLK